MDKSLPGRLSVLRENVALLTLSMAVQHDVVECLDEIAVRIYSLEEDRKRLLETVRKQQTEIDSLRTRYAELLYRLADK